MKGLWMPGLNDAACREPSISDADARLHLAS